MSDTAIDTPTSVKLLDPALDEQAAGLLARCPRLGDRERASREIADARADEKATVLGVIAEGELAGAYILRRASMSNEIGYLAIGPAFERRGLGKMCLYDALLRSGKRPLVVEADDSNLAFFKHCGFKLVGKRSGPDGVRYRLGWHAPIPHPDAPGKVIC